ncbi:hypothetical protein [Marinobacter sp. AC-23]|uniref:hypothetical protein n=1 Tax=Marinobacter sp. AC-23 TaxID=1879031 RepID=UPI0020C87ADF|nr:hypothetical protein [Marinobacter sp. AC-23]
MKKLALNALTLGISLAFASTAFASDFTDMDPVTLRLAHVSMSKMVFILPP